MSTYRLDKLFSPRSVAVVGASPRETSPGRAVLRNLASAGFEGSVSLVNPHYGEIEGIEAVKTIQELRQAPDLIVIAAPPRSVPGIIAAAMRKAPRRRRRIPARSRAPTRSTTPRFIAPACCGCSISTSCLPRRRRSDGYGRFRASGW